MTWTKFQDTKSSTGWKVLSFELKTRSLQLESMPMGRTIHLLNPGMGDRYADKICSNSRRECGTDAEIVQHCGFSKTISQHSLVTCHCPPYSLSMLKVEFSKGEPYISNILDLQIFSKKLNDNISFETTDIFHIFSLFFLDTFLTYVWFHHFLRRENIISGTARTPAQQNTQKQATEAHCLGCRSFFYFSICWSMELVMRQSVCHPES